MDAGAHALSFLGICGVYGVPEDLDESHVAKCLVQGSKELVKPEDRKRFL